MAGVETNVSVYLLKSVRDLMRFETMNGTFFVRHVQSLNVLNTNELITILSYYQFPGRGCGAFSTEHRRTEQELEFTLSMSSKLSTQENSFEALQSVDLAQGCGTTGSDAVPFIEARFGQRVCVHEI